MLLGACRRQAAWPWPVPTRRSCEALHAWALAREHGATKGLASAIPRPPPDEHCPDPLSLSVRRFTTSSVLRGSPAPDAVALAAEAELSPAEVSPAPSSLSAAEVSPAPSSLSAAEVSPAPSSLSTAEVFPVPSSLSPRACPPHPSARGVAWPVRVCVVTGDVRGAGSPTPLEIQLLDPAGRASASATVLNADASLGLRRGARVWAELAEPAGSEELLGVAGARVRALPRAAPGRGRPWFLDRLELEDALRRRWRVPCGVWIYAEGGRGRGRTGEREAESLFGDEARRIERPVRAEALSSSTVGLYHARLHAPDAAFFAPSMLRDPAPAGSIPRDSFEAAYELSGEDREADVGAWASEPSLSSASRSPPPPLRLRTSACVLPHPEKAAKAKAVTRQTAGHGGDDAYACTLPGADPFVLAVADGVTSWRAQGVDAGVYARALVERCVALAQARAEAVPLARGAAPETPEQDALDVVRAAEASVREQGVPGSATLLLGVVDCARGRLLAATLGDAGLLVLGRRGDEAGRAGGRLTSSSPLAPAERLAGDVARVPDVEDDMQVVYASPQQEHKFGYPYQLGSQAAADPPQAALLASVRLRRGDVLVAGSDGLLDNLHERRMLELARQTVGRREGPGALARALAFAAFDAARDAKSNTPYSVAASDEFDLVYSGGKMDDITVLVAYVE